MRLDPNPLFRRVISPWYDSAPARWTTLIGMLAVAVFSATGIWVARQNPDYHVHTWVPVTLLLLSLLVLISTVHRMARCAYDRNSQDR
jgi:uncharacterized membrane protein